MDRGPKRKIEDHGEEAWFEEVSVENDPSDTNWNSLVALVSGINNQITELDTEVNEVDSRLRHFEEQQTISISTIRKKVEVLRSQIPSLKSVLKTVDIDPVAPPLSSLLKPIQSREELDELENKAKDEEYRNAVAQAAGRIFGYGRIGKGEVICYEMVDYFFDRKFLMECSWHGYNRTFVNGELKKKVGFINYDNTIKLFHECVCISDETFTESDCYNFVKVKMLRNTLRRVQAKKIRMPSKIPRVRSKKTDTGSDLAVQAVVANQLRHLQSTGGNS
ncbi:uncharacterized protein LOC125949998 [Anopheles darlingi]|uniref:uncharacterized protein LOC125949998 n=1 Tax=Anopheles darlingi TaxID=43151 RepID=UPI0020FFF7AE|nr:uncharacterized protein LOC125949998 [Anopheles darlingi]XP_049533492.1 uncharacterized protein LOC125949998 [Anopheles darlingi]